MAALETRLRIIAFGAHPDDCEGRAGGTCVKYAQLGHRVKFVSLTNGDAGHMAEGGGALARRRAAEARESARRLGIEAYDIIDNHDGELLPTLDVRRQVIRKIREWQADIVMAPRPWDYHPDHRYTGMAVQDAAYMVMVPNICQEVPALRANPVFFYFEDEFQSPYPFRPDVAVAIDDVYEQKLSAFDAHVSQFYEWIPFSMGVLEQVPAAGPARREWLAGFMDRFFDPVRLRTALRKWYGTEADSIQRAEGFEICEYGRQPPEEELRRLFPFLPGVRK